MDRDIHIAGRPAFAARDRPEHVRERDWMLGEHGTDPLYERGEIFHADARSDPIDPKRDRPVPTGACVPSSSPRRRHPRQAWLPLDACTICCHPTRGLG